MSKNVFNATFDANNSVNRNVFDLSHVNNFTAKIGTIYPVFTKLMPANSSIKIDPQFALRFMPMAFPIQTRMKARLSFFRVPLRTLWKDYADYQGNFKKNLEPPYIDFDADRKYKEMASTGSLGDYLGLPTTGVDYELLRFTLGRPMVMQFRGPTTHALGSGSPNRLVFKSFFGSYPGIDLSDNFVNLLPDGVHSVENFSLISSASYSEVFSAKLSALWKLSVPSSIDAAYYKPGTVSRIELTFDVRSPYMRTLKDFRLLISNDNSSLFEDSNKGMYLFSPVLENNKLTFDLNSISIPLKKFHLFVVYIGDYAGVSKEEDYEDPFYSVELFGPSKVADYGLLKTKSPYFSSASSQNKKQLKISAYRFRAYESIYNSFYRDNRNNPFMIDGQPEYNKFLPTLDGGADKNVYSLRRANWEQDFLTTAVQSPQQGIAPLVGLTTYEKVVKGEDGITTVTSSVAIVDESGRKYGLSFNSDADGLTDVKYTELSESEVVKPTRSLFDLAQTGISITDLRNVNAYQKFLELNMRKGYSYKDIIEGRFDVKVKYDELMRPVFIGGMTRDVNVSPVTQSVESPTANGDYAGALGSQAGLGYVLGEGESITTFCDEESLIMGMMVVVPIPCYSQLLPKDMIYRDLLDHYAPEFNHIGFQPITYAEVCPIQAYSTGKSLQDVFGYQRPWYEYVSETDKVHGLFRTSLHGFLMNRYFNTFPQLSEQFLLVDDKQVNDVFSVTTTDDKILGQIYFNVSAKLPIARVAIPRLD